MSNRAEELKKDLQDVLRKHGCEIRLTDRRIPWSEANLIEIQFDDGDPNDDFEFEGVDKNSFWGGGKR